MYKATEKLVGNSFIVWKSSTLTTGEWHETRSWARWWAEGLWWGMYAASRYQGATKATIGKQVNKW